MVKLQIKSHLITSQLRDGEGGSDLNGTCVQRSDKVLHANTDVVARGPGHLVLWAYRGCGSACRRHHPGQSGYDGKPAARVGDGTANGAPVVEGSRDVFINSRPAAIAGGRNGCGGVVVGGASNVFINGRPVAQAGSLTSDCTGR
jgi:uncharacterized Zn-binding protein involved in type VI secretion